MKKRLLSIPVVTAAILFTGATSCTKNNSFSKTATNDTKARSVTAGDTILNVTYENGTTNSGITGVSGSHATAVDADYMVQPGATGNYAVAHKVVYGDSAYWSDGNWRSESDAVALTAARFAPGQERRYEFSALLKDWTPWNTGDPINETNIYQLKVSAGNPVPLQVRTQRNALRLRYGTMTGNIVKDIVADLRPFVNQWMHFRIDVKWTSDNTGSMKVYMKLPGESNYALKDSMINYRTFTGDTSIGNVGYIKWGAYVVPANITRIVYHDDIRIIAL